MRFPTLTLLPFSASLTQAFLNSESDTQHTLTADSSPPSYRTSLLSLHKSLVTVPSVVGTEGSVALFLRSYLLSLNLNLTVELQPIRPNSSRFNVLAYPGTRRQSRILLTSHVDTVPPFLPYSYTSSSPESDPSAVHADDLITGRGAVDAKGSVAAQIIALHSLLSESDSISPSDVGLLFVAGEEAGGQGMRAANSLGLSWETVIFGEPTERKLACGHKGALGFVVTARGTAGHSGYPATGRNAIDGLVEVLAGIKKLKLPWSAEMGNTTVNVGMIRGGVAGNVIPEWAEAKLSVRVAGASPETVRGMLEGVVGQAAKSVDAEVGVDFTAGLGEVKIDCDVPGFETAVMSYGTDIWSLEGDHKRYLYGPGSILDAHSAHESLTVAELEASVEGYKTLILAALRRDSGSEL